MTPELAVQVFRHTLMETFWLSLPLLAILGLVRFRCVFSVTEAACSPSHVECVVSAWNTATLF